MNTVVGQDTQYKPIIKGTLFKSLLDVAALCDSERA